MFLKAASDGDVQSMQQFIDEGAEINVLNGANGEVHGPFLCLSYILLTLFTFL